MMMPYTFKRSPIWLWACLPLLIALQPQASAQVQQTPPAAIVATFDRAVPRGSTGHKVILVRVGAPERIAMLGEFLREGDVIRVPEADVAVTIKTREKKIEICQPGGAPGDCLLKITGSGSAFTEAVRFVDQLARISNWYGTQSSVSLISRAGPAKPLKPDAFVERHQVIFPGSRAIHVHWNGGSAPFKIELSSQARPIVSATSSKNGVSLPKSDFKPGKYLLDVLDGKSQKTSFAFEVAAPKAAQPDFSGIATSDENRAFLEAGWLAAQQDGALVFEAIQRLAPIADIYQPAMGLLLGLRQNVRPKTD